MSTIIILGAGFGGLRCALSVEAELRRYLRGSTPEAEGWKVVLVDRNPYQIYFPRLYELTVAQETRSKKQGAGCVIEIKDILKGTNIEFIQAEIKGIECKKKVITLSNNKALPFDYLVLALGAGTDYFGILGLKEYACTLKSVEDAACIREAVAEFLNTHNPPQPSLNLREGDRSAPPLKIRGGRGSYDKPFSIVIGGAGATGVEVAAELAYLFRKVPRGLWSVRVVEALSSVLWMFPTAVGEYAHQRLIKLGVQVMLDTCIKRVEPAGSHPERSEGSRVSKNDGIPRFAWNDGGRIEIVLAPRPLKPGEDEVALVCDFLPEHEKRISADILLWAGGVRATPLLSRCALPVDRKGRMEVDEYLRVKDFDNVFAIGDDATLINPKDQKPVPATAQAAVEQGKLVAENIGRLINAKTRDPISVAAEIGSPSIQLRAYKFHDFPAIIPLGGNDGVAYVGGRVFTGFFSWFLRKAADWRYLASILGWWKAIKMLF